VTADTNPVYRTEQGYDTEDRVFLLSTKEAEHYFSSDDERRFLVTAYATNEGAGNRAGYGSCWLRTMGQNKLNAALVWYDGSIDYAGENTYDVTYVIRPALWLQPIPTEGSEQSNVAQGNNQVYYVACSNATIDDSKDDEISIKDTDFNITVTDFWSDSAYADIEHEYPAIIIHHEQTEAFDTLIHPECETNTLKYLYSSMNEYNDFNEDKSIVTTEKGKPFKVNGMTVYYFTVNAEFKKGYAFEDGDVVEKDYFVKSLISAVPISDDKILVVYVGCYWYPDEKAEYTVDEDTLKEIYEHIDIETID
jgi:hypothetical protein